MRQTDSGLQNRTIDKQGERPTAIDAPSGRRIGVSVPRRRDPAGRRQAIIEAAGRVIAEVGFGNLTHRKVAHSANVPVGSVTYYFKDLNELRDAALDAVTKSRIEILQHWAREFEDDPDIATVLARLLANIIRERSQNRAVNELYTAASHRPELQDLSRMWSTGLIAVLQEHVSTAAARAIAVFLDGVLLHALITDQPLDPKEIRLIIAQLSIL